MLKISAIIVDLLVKPTVSSVGLAIYTIFLFPVLLVSYIFAGIWTVARGSPGPGKPCQLCRQCGACVFACACMLISYFQECSPSGPPKV